MQRSRLTRYLIIAAVLAAVVVAFHVFASDTLEWLKAMHGRPGAGGHR